MLNRVAANISKRLLSNGAIPEEMFDVYVYGFELLISSLFTTTVLLLMGIFSRQVLQTIAFLITFILLRSFTGGYHAKTYLTCSMVTFSLFVIVLVLSSFLFVPVHAYIVLAVVGLSLVFLFAPVENANKELSQNQKRKFKIISCILFLLIVAIGLSLKNFFSHVSNVVFFTLAADIFLLLIKNKKERRIKDEDH